MTTKQNAHVALVGAAVALGDIAVSHFNGRAPGALHVLICCILTAHLTARILSASLRA